MLPGQETGLPPLTRRLLGWEIVVVFAVSLGASALLAIISLIGSLTARKALGHQQALLVGSMAPGRPWLDLSLQLANILVTLAPVAPTWSTRAPAAPTRDPGPTASRRASRRRVSRRPST